MAQSFVPAHKRITERMYAGGAELASPLGNLEYLHQRQRTYRSEWPNAGALASSLVRGVTPCSRTPRTRHRVRFQKNNG